MSIQEKIPVCSVCIANYNGEDVLRECIESLYSQKSNRVKLEIIVHDDASTDDSKRLIRENYPDVLLLCSDSNVGYCESNNRMAKAASGEYLLLLNNDAALFPDGIDVLFAHCEKQEKKGVITLPQFNRGTRENIDYGNDVDLFLNPIPRSGWTKPDVSTVHGACLWIPRDLWAEIGGFPLWFDSVAEDLYLCLYAECLGYPVQVAGSSGYWHWVGNSFGGGKIQNGRLATTYKRRFLSERNRTYVMILFFPFYGLGIILIHMLSLFAEGLVLSLLKRDSKIWTQIYGRAIFDVLKTLRVSLSSRKLISKKNGISRKSVLKKVLWRHHKFNMWFKFGLPAIS